MVDHQSFIDSQAQPTGIVKPRRWRRWILISTLVILAGLLTFHGQILTAVGYGLVRSQPLPEAGHLLLWRDADGKYDLAAEVHRRDSNRKILLVQTEPDRLQRLGLAPTDVDEFRQELSRRGIPSEAFEIIAVDPKVPTAPVERFKRWLEEHPQQPVVIVCDQLRSRELSLAFSEGLGDRQGSVVFHGLPDRRYGPADWWKTRPGIRTVTLGWLRLTEAWFRGGADDARKIRWDPAELEAELRKVAEEPKDKPAVERPKGWLPAIANWLDQGDPPAAVDYVLSLPGDQNTRPFASSAIVNAGLARGILIPRNHASPQELDGIAEPTHELTRKICLQQGVPEEKIIVLPGASDSTVEDALCATEFLKEMPEAKIAVVTNFYHTRRARIALESVYGRQINRFTFFSVPTDDFGPEDWWRDRTGTFLILSEYVKLVLYWIQYGDGVIWIGATVIVLLSLVSFWRVRRRRRRAERSARLNPLPVSADS